MSERKGMTIFFVLAFLLALSIGSTSEASTTTIGTTKVGVGFVKESDSSSSTDSSSTDPSNSQTQDTTTSTEITQSSESSNIRINQETPKGGAGNETIPNSSAKMLPSTGEKNTVLWIVLGVILIMMVFIFNRLYERKRT